jgi:hypothetical protein
MTARAFLERHAKRMIRRRLLAGRFSEESFSYAEPSSIRPAAPVKVLMCLWNRPGRLAEVMDMLDGQTNAPGGVELHLWNNNKLDHEHYREVLRTASPSGALVSAHIVRTPYNLGSMGRFYLARKLATTEGEQPVIVIDDDEDFSDSLVSTALAHYSPRSIHAFWAFEVGDAYFARVPSVPGGRTDHIGPGGSVMNAVLFLDDGFFTGLPERYFMLDDLWLTYYAKTHGYTLAKLPVDIEFVMDETNQYHTQLGMKEQFFNELYNS